MATGKSGTKKIQCAEGAGMERVGMSGCAKDLVGLMHSALIRWWWLRRWQSRSRDFRDREGLNWGCESEGWDGLGGLWCA